MSEVHGSTSPVCGVTINLIVELQATRYNQFVGYSAQRKQVPPALDKCGCAELLLIAELAGGSPGSSRSVVLIVVP